MYHTERLLKRIDQHSIKLYACKCSCIFRRRIHADLLGGGMSPISGQGWVLKCRSQRLKGPTAGLGFLGKVYEYKGSLQAPRAGSGAKSHPLEARRFSCIPEAPGGLLELVEVKFGGIPLPLNPRIRQIFLTHYDELSSLFASSRSYVGLYLLPTRV